MKQQRNIDIRVGVEVGKVLEGINGKDKILNICS